MNSFEILGVFPTATKQEIRNAYLSLVKIHHPDKGGTSEKFQEISNAYEELMKDPVDFPEINIFKMMGRTVRTNLIITIEEFESGGVFHVYYTKKVASGKGKRIVISTPFGDLAYIEPEEIDEIHSTYVELPRCFPEKEFIKSQSSFNLIINICIKEHEHINKITNLDIHTKLTIDLKEALTGFSKNIDTLSTRDPLNIECISVISPTDTKVIKGHGLFNGNEHGDLILKFNIVFPIILSQETKNTIKQLDF